MILFRFPHLLVMLNTFSYFPDSLSLSHLIFWKKIIQVLASLNLSQIQNLHLGAV